MPYLSLADLDLFYEDAVSGEAILFLHSSFSRGVRAFAAQIPVFSPHYRCLLPDMRGHGETEAPGLEWTVPQLAGDMVAFLEALGVERAHLIGYSLGADVALYCLIMRPEMFLSLTAIGTAGRVTEETIRQADDYEPGSLERRGMRDFIEAMKEMHATAHRGNWRRFVSVSVDNWRRYPDIPFARLADLRQPCLLIAGEDDPFASGSQLEELRRAIPNAESLRIPGCGHRPHMAGFRPEMVNEAIQAFLRKVR